MKRKTAYCAMWLLLIGFPLDAQTKIAADDGGPFSTLRKLVSLCEANGFEDAAHGALPAPVAAISCASYILGFADGWDETLTEWLADSVLDALKDGRVAPSEKATDKFLDSIRKAKTHAVGICIEKTWTPAYVSAVVVQYGREHPSELDRPAHEAMLKILAKAFPCDQKKNR